MRNILFLFPLLCLGFFVEAQNVTATPADNRPLDSTLQWIKQQLENGSGAAYRITAGSGAEKHSWKSTNTYHDFQFKGCEMEFGQTHRRDDGEPREIHYTVPLWDIASVTYKLDDGDHSGNKDFKYTPPVPSLWIMTRSNSIHWTKPNTFFPTNQAEIEFGHDLAAKGGHADREDTLQRLVTAFRHAADLCVSQTPRKKAVTSEPASTPAP